jgi:hypothetical protein
MYASEFIRIEDIAVASVTFSPLYKFEDPKLSESGDPFNRRHT